MNKNWPLHFNVNEGDITTPSFRTKLNRLIGHTKHYGSGDYTLVIKKRRNKRSNPQNAYYWGVVIPMITQRFIDLGNKCTNDLVHEYLKDRFGIREEVYDREVIVSTSKYRKGDFMDYLEEIIQWSAEALQIVIPDPETAKSKLIY